MTAKPGKTAVLGQASWPRPRLPPQLGHRPCGDPAPARFRGSGPPPILPVSPPCRLCVCGSESAQGDFAKYRGAPPRTNL